MESRASVVALELVFALLPLDSKLAASGVCCAWREILKKPHWWTTLDLSSVERANDALLRCCARRAGPHLRELNVSGCLPILRSFEASSETSALLSAVRQGPALEVIRCQGVFLSTAAWTALLQAAPRLKELHACVKSTQSLSTFPVLRARGLKDVFSPDFVRVAVEHAPLEELELERVRLDFDADVDSLALLTTCRGQLKSLCLSSAT